MKTILNQNEIAIHEDNAGLYYGFIAGHLYLTSQRIIFEPSDLTPIPKTTISLNDIVNIQVKSRRFLWLIPMDYLGWVRLIITTKQRPYHLIVRDGLNWQNAILATLKIGKD